MPTQSSSPERKLITRRQTHRGQFFTELIRLRDEKKYQTIYLDELPRHLVTVPSFFMGKYPITQAQWHSVATSYQKVIQELNPTPSHFKGDRLPVEQVSWDDAQEFCRRLSNQQMKVIFLSPFIVVKRSMLLLPTIVLKILKFIKNTIQEFTIAESLENIVKEPLKSKHFYPMLLVSMTCTEMSGNGAKMTGILIIKTLLMVVLLGLKAIVKMLIDFCEAVHGATIP